MWTSTDYPSPLRSLSEEVRNKAIEFANELVNEGIEQDNAVAIAIERAMKWADRHGIEIIEKNAKEKKHGKKEHSFMVIPTDNDWAVREEFKREKK